MLSRSIAEMPVKEASAESLIFSVSDMDKLLLIIDGALKVRRRQDFFSWAQGALHIMLPHDALICVLNQGHEFVIDNFSSFPLQKNHGDFLFSNGEEGLIARLLANWIEGGRRPVVYRRGAAGDGVDPALAAQFERLPFAHVAAHGGSSAGGAPGHFFVLLNQSIPARSAHQSYLLEMLVPYLHAAWVRVHLGRVAEEPALASRTLARPRVLTPREVEILRWAHDGKSNIEIGMILGISSLTVKNHIQKILRKLNVQNRTQAVSKSLSLNILRAPRN